MNSELIFDRFFLNLPGRARFPQTPSIRPSL